MRRVVTVPCLPSAQAESSLRQPCLKNNTLRLHIVERGVWLHILPFARRDARILMFPPGARMMRKLLILSIVVLAAGAAGCTRGPCGESWRPGQSLFGSGRQNYGYQQGADCCCDPSGGGGGYGGYMQPSPMMAPGAMMAPAPGMTQAPCCQ